MEGTPRYIHVRRSLPAIPRYILAAGMKCVFCIGEPLPIREKVRLDYRGGILVV